MDQKFIYMKKICYCDENLQVTEDEAKIKAFVNLISDVSVEVLFLEPIGHNKNKLDASTLIREFRGNYPSYRTSFPNYQTCELYNEICYPQIIKNCYTANLELDRGYQKFVWTAIMDNGGRSKPINTREEIMENVYVSVIMPRRFFEAINPQLVFNEYINSPVNN